MSTKNLDPQLQRFKKGAKRAVQTKDRAALESLFHEGYSLVDENGEVIDRAKALEMAVDSKTTLSKLYSLPSLHTSIQSESGTIREVSEVDLAGNRAAPPGEAERGAVGNFICTAIYVNGSGSDLRVIANTITKIEEPRIGKPAPAQ